MPISGFGANRQSPFLDQRNLDLQSQQLREQKKGRKQQLYLDIARMLLENRSRAAGGAIGMGGRY